MFFIFGWGVGGQKFESNPIIFERLHKKTLRAAMTLQEKLSSAHSIRSCPSSEGKTWVPCEKGSHSELHVSKKRTKFTGAFRRFLGTTTKICQGFFISQTLKTHKKPSGKTDNWLQENHPLFQQEIPSDPFRVHFPASQRDTPGDEVIVQKKPCSQNLRGYTRGERASKLRNFQKKDSG